jgi:hypothetical protein
MPKQLRIKTVDATFAVTIAQLTNWLTGGQYQIDSPVILKCGGKNYRLARVFNKGGKPVLIGRRRASDK